MTDCSWIAGGILDKYLLGLSDVVSRVNQSTHPINAYEAVSTAMFVPYRYFRTRIIMFGTNNAIKPTTFSLIHMRVLSSALLIFSYKESSIRRSWVGYDNSDQIGALFTF